MMERQGLWMARYCRWVCCKLADRPRRGGPLGSIHVRKLEKATPSPNDQTGMFSHMRKGGWGSELRSGIDFMVMH